MSHGHTPPSHIPNRHIPNLAEFEEMARAAWLAIPAGFREMAKDVVIVVQDVADRQTLEALGIDHPLQLSGLYHGVDLTRRSVTHPAPFTPMVYLYRRAIINEWLARESVTLQALISHVLVHEIGHHFGFSDDDMHAILDGED